jgi:hypothetical protein
MKFKLFAALLALVIAVPALAEKDRGGGNALVCFNTKKVFNQVKEKHGTILTDEQVNDIRFIEVLDLLEAKAVMNLSVNATGVVGLLENETPEAYVERILQRFDTILPLMTQAIREARGHFPESNRRWQNLFKVDDINPVGPAIGSNCLYATIATQDDAFLYFDKRLMLHPKHSKQSRAVLLLHEYIRRHSMKLHSQFDDARPTRGLVSLMIRKKLGLTMNQFQNTLKALYLFPGWHYFTEERLYPSLHRLRYKNFFGQRKYITIASEEYVPSTYTEQLGADISDDLRSLTLEALKEYRPVGIESLRSRFLEMITPLNSPSCESDPKCKQIKEEVKKLEDELKANVLAKIQKRYETNWLSKVRTIPLVSEHVRNQVHESIAAFIQSISNEIPGQWISYKFWRIYYNFEAGDVEYWFEEKLRQSLEHDLNYSLDL